jgi:hypothetical protein
VDGCGYEGRLEANLSGQVGLPFLLVLARHNLVARQGPSPSLIQ